MAIALGRGCLMKIVLHSGDGVIVRQGEPDVIYLAR